MSVTRLTISNQFGFEKKHRTDLCIYVLKEVIDRHRSLYVYMFLDVSEAFDRVKHSILFQKLIDGECLDILLDCLYIGIRIRLCV